jgi:positive regulator of sigma E activity
MCENTACCDRCKSSKTCEGFTLYKNGKRYIGSEEWMTPDNWKIMPKGYVPKDIADD